MIESKNIFRSGATWPDMNGHHIDAHGGGILFYAGVYYWFGEHRAPVLGDASTIGGVRAYSSRDLFHWQDEGAVLTLMTEGDLVPGCKIERPKVIFNARTKRFVMWFHLELSHQEYTGSLAGVAVAECVTGPYRFLRATRQNAGVWPLNVPEELKTPLTADEQLYLSTFPKMDGPHPTYPTELVFRRDFAAGQMSRDMTLFVDDDGTAYHLYSSEGNGTLHLSQLTEDYLQAAGSYMRISPGAFNEAPAVFKHAGTYYLLASGCSGWRPNTARLLSAPSIWGPWKYLGDPCRGAHAETTFFAQSTFVLPVQNRPGAFIFMADQWKPKEQHDSRYVWLPVQFGADQSPFVQWLDEWELSFFDPPKFAVLRRQPHQHWARRDDDEWWIERARTFAQDHAETQPVIWHDVSIFLSNLTTEFGFPPPADRDPQPGISFHTAGVLDPERALAAYDRGGVSAIVGLQTGKADPVECLQMAHRVLGHHACVIGYALDGEFYDVEKSGDRRGGPISDELARTLLETVTGFSPELTLFLRHAEAFRLPQNFQHRQLKLLGTENGTDGFVY